MTVYTFKKTVEEVEEAEVEALEEKRKREEALYALGKVIGLFAKPAILMLLWNWLMPGIFGIAAIGYFKAFGLYLLARILFDKND